MPGLLPNGGLDHSAGIEALVRWRHPVAEGIETASQVDAQAAAAFGDAFLLSM